MQDARSVSSSPDTCVGLGRQEESSFSLANSMQESVTFRDIFSISSVFRLGEVDGLKDLLINGQVATTAFKEFPNVPQQLK